MTPKVFISYARNDLQSDELGRFLDALDKELRVQLGTPASVLFRDSADVQLGEDWAATIDAALRTASFMLALCSPSYLSSEYCGKEFTAFAERLESCKRAGVAPESVPRAIIPIIWMQPPESGLPSPLAALEYDNDQLPPTYAQHGLRQLFRLKRYEDDALAAVTAFAAALVKAAQGPQLPVVAALKPLKQQHNLLRMTPASAACDRGAEFNGPNLARIVIAAGSREEIEQVRTFVSAYDSQAWSWRPYAPDSDRPIGADVQVITANSGLRCEFVPVDDNVCARIQEAARHNEIVIVLADPWTLRLPAYAGRLSPLDQLFLVNCGVLMVWNGADQETAQQAANLQSTLRGVFSMKSRFPPPGHVFSGINSNAELKQQLEKALTEARLRIIETAPAVRRVDSQQLSDQAAQSGIDPLSRATLQGPSGAPT